jgi:DNA mismatch repair protein MutS
MNNSKNPSLNPVPSKKSRSTTNTTGKENIVDFYLRHDTKYRELYGALTIILMESGHFYEIYDYLPPQSSPHLQCCIDVLGILVTRRDKSNPESPYMAGIPTHSIRRYFKLLLQSNYTVVCLTQTCMTPTVVREVTRILSPGCNLSEDVHESADAGSSVLVAATVELDAEDEVCYMHLSTFDSNTGRLTLQQLGAVKLADAADSLSAGLATVAFHEALLQLVGDSSQSPAFAPFVAIVSQWKDAGKATHVRRIAADHFSFKRSFQTQCAERHFAQFASGFCSIWESLGLEREEAGSVANMLHLLEFVEKHDRRLVQKLERPHVCSSPGGSGGHASQQQGAHMRFYNDAHAKLNILSGDGRMSLFTLLNCTNTKMGERLLRARLTDVSCEPAAIASRYEKVRCLLREEASLSALNTQLRSVDLERAWRRFTMGTLQPHEIPKVASAHEAMLLSFETARGAGRELANHVRAALPDDWWGLARKLDARFKQTFDADACAEARIGKYPRSIFRPGAEPAVDGLAGAERAARGALEGVAELLDGICVGCMGGGAAAPGMVTLKSSDKEGYWLETTKLRGAKLQAALAKHQAKLKPHAADDFKFVASGKALVRVVGPAVSAMSDALVDAKAQLDEATTQAYASHLRSLYDGYFSCCIGPGVELLAELDVALSAAKCAQKYRLVEPELEECGGGEGDSAPASSVAAEQLRHPLIEHLLSGQGKAYTPNDIAVSHESCYLLHGVNSVGKSSLLKSVAVGVVMAQAGLYVAAARFRLRPFRKLFARTGNDDNLFVHHSSFVKEMSETKEIVRHSDAHSLVIADELCASTELDSATRIVGCLLQLLAERRCAYVFATHLFALQENHFVRQLLQKRTLRNAYLKVRFEHKRLVFERTLSDGLPENRLYGAMVAEKVIDSPAFTHLLEATDAVLCSVDDSAGALSELMGGLAVKPAAANGQHANGQKAKSKYNAALWLEECAICAYRPQKPTDMPLDTHHIHAQCSADKDGFIGHAHKNERHNLVALCKQCHRDTHAGLIEVRGYLDTSDGRVLEWERKDAEAASGGGGADGIKKSANEYETTALHDADEEESKAKETKAKGKCKRKYDESTIGSIRSIHAKLQSQKNKTEIWKACREQLQINVAYRTYLGFIAHGESDGQDKSSCGCIHKTT